MSGPLEEMLSPTPFWDLARDGNTWLIAAGNLYLVGEEKGDGEPRKMKAGLAYKGKTFSIEESCSFMFLVERALTCRDGAMEQLLGESGNQGKENVRVYWARVAMLANGALERMYAAAPEESVGQGMSSACEDISLEVLLDGLSLPRVLRQPLLIEEGRCTRFAANKNAGTCDMEFRGRSYVAVERAVPAAIEEEVRRALAASLGRRMRLLREEREQQEGDGSQQQGIILYDYARKRVAFRLAVEEFAIMKAGKCYAFPATELEVEVRPGRKFAYVGGPARIASMPYAHPFVYPDSNICHGQMERFTRRGVYFSLGYRRDEPEHLASIIAVVLDEARKTLQNGYLSGVKPVHRLTNGLFDGNLITENKARTRGIRVYRQ